MSQGSCWYLGVCVKMRMLEEASDNNIRNSLCTGLFIFWSALWTPQNPWMLGTEVFVSLLLMRVQKLSNESQRRYVKFMGEPQLQAGSSEDCPHAFPWKNIDLGMSWCLNGARAMSASPTRGSAVAHIAGRHVSSSLRRPWCSVMRSTTGGEALVKSLPGTLAWSLEAILPLPHQPCRICPKVLSHFTVSQV